MSMIYKQNFLFYSLFFDFFYIFCTIYRVKCNWYPYLNNLYSNNYLTSILGAAASTVLDNSSKMLNVDGIFIVFYLKNVPYHFLFFICLGSWQCFHFI